MKTGIAAISRVHANLVVTGLFLGAQPAIALGAEGSSYDVLSTQYLLQVLGSLLLVLAGFFLLAFVLKRFNAVQGSGEKQIQVLASAKLGSREKLMLVRVAGQLLVLGVAPGNMRTLHTFCDEAAAPAEENKAVEGSFAGLMKAAVVDGEGR